MTPTTVTPVPTPSPTPGPTPGPTPSPTPSPTMAPVPSTDEPTVAPVTSEPTVAPVQTTDEQEATASGSHASFRLVEIGLAAWITTVLAHLAA
jgi:hypothetical protein